MLVSLGHVELVDTSRVSRAGAALLVLGGLLEAAASAIGSLVSPPTTTLPGASLVVSYSTGTVLVGLGLIATGAAFQDRERVALVIAGVVALLIPMVNTAQTVTGAPFGPAPSQLAYFLFVVAVLFAALTLLRDVGLVASVRWSLAVPAAFFLLDVVALFAPLPSVPGTIVLPWAGVAAAGVMLFRSAGRDRKRPADFVLGGPRQPGRRL